MMTPQQRLRLIEIEEAELALEEEEEAEGSGAASEQDLARGSKWGRTKRGVAALPLGAFQLGANTGDLINENAPEPLEEMEGLNSISSTIADNTVFPLLRALGFDGGEEPLGDQFNQALQDYDESKSRGQRALGDGDFDAYGLGGEILTGGIATKGMQGLKGAIEAGTKIAALTPTTGGDDFWADKAKQTAGGALMGGGGYGAIKGITSGGGKIGDLYKYYRQSGKDLLGTTLRKTLGDKADDVATRLEADYNDLTPGSAAEVASGAGSTKFAAMQQAADDLAPDEAFARKALQDRLRVKVVDDIADVKIQGREPEEFREAISGPLRERALGNASQNTAREQALKKTMGEIDDTGGYYQQNPRQTLAQLRAQRADPDIPRQQPVSRPAGSSSRSLPNSMRSRAELEGAKRQAQNRSDTGRTPWGGRIHPKNSPQRDFLKTIDDRIDEAKLIEDLNVAERTVVKGQIDKMAEKGIKGAKPNSIIDGINKAMKTPKVVGNSVVRKLMRSMKTELEGMVKKDGTIDPKALYEFRMNTLDLRIEQALGKASSSQRQRVTSQLSAIKPLLDDVIESAAGGGWKKYLRTYSKLSRPVSQGKIGENLRTAMTNDLAEGQVRSSVLAKAIAAEKATMKKSGVRGETFDEVLYPRQRKQLGKLQRDLQRQELTKRQASEASQTKGDVKDVHVPKMGNALIRPIMIGNFLSKRIMMGRVKEVEAELVKLFQRDPDKGFASLAEAIRNAPPEGKKIVREWVTEFGGRYTGGAAGVTAGQIGEQ